VTTQLQLVVVVVVVAVIIIITITTKYVVVKNSRTAIQLEFKN
jgi:uncharacterized membrane protein YqiK